MDINRSMILNTLIDAIQYPAHIKEKIWHESQELHPQDDGSIIFEAEVAGTEEIRFWIMSWGSHALVLEPEPLRDEIRTDVERLLNRYENEGEKGEMAYKT